MKALATRYLNEIVGLAVLALMTVALIAGQADATVHQSLRNDKAAEDSHFSASLETVTDAATFRADIEVQLDLDRLIDVAAEEDARAALRDLIRIKLDRKDQASD